MQGYKLSDRWKAFWVSTLTLLAFYGITAAPSITLMDAGDLITGARTFGLAHPPGYPSFTLLGAFFGKIFWFLEPAHQMNLLNAAYAAFACGVLSLIVFELFAHFRVAIFAGLALGLTSITWSLAATTEVYALNLLLNNLLWLLALQFRRSHSPKIFSWFSFVLGLSLTNSYPLILLSGLGMILIFPKETYRPRLILRGAGFFILGLLPYVYLYFQSVRSDLTAYHFFDISGTEKVYPYVMRSSYGILDSKVSTLLEKGHVFILLISTLIKDFALTSVCVVGGVVAAYHSRWIFRWPFMIATLASSVLLYLLLGTSSDDETFVQFSEYLLPTISYLAVFSAFGIIWFLERSKVSRKLIATALVFALMTQFALAFPQANFGSSKTVESWGTTLLESLPQNASLIFTSDRSFPLYYLQIVRQKRPDISIYSSYLNTLDGQRYYYKKGGEVTQSIAAQLSLTGMLKEAKAPVYLADQPTRFIQEGYNLALKGLAYQFVTEVSPDQAGMVLSKESLKTLLDAIMLGTPIDDYWTTKLRVSSASRLLVYASLAKIIDVSEWKAFISQYKLDNSSAFFAAAGAEFAYAKQFDLAVESFERIDFQSMDELDPDPIAIFCRVLLFREDYARAQVVCAMPDRVARACNADAKYNLGRAFWGDRDKSMAYFQEAIRCEPRVVIFKDMLEKRRAAP